MNSVSPEDIASLITLKARPLGIDTYRQPVVYMRADCPVCRSEGFEALARVRVRTAERSIIATLNVVTSDLLSPGEAGMSVEAWRRLGLSPGDGVRFNHAPITDSFSHVRAKLFGHRLEATAFDEIVTDIAAGLYTDVQLSAFITACAGNHLHVAEMKYLTRSMVQAGKQLKWPSKMVVDKHCVGGLPGNRTTPIVVAVVASAGLIIPKTSSRAITSPAGTADVMETLTNVTLDADTLVRVVEQEGGCLAWGGAMQLSPVDDMLVRVEHVLDLDSQGQLVASVLSKKVAAGATHVVIDIPVGPTAKVRSLEAGRALGRDLEDVGAAVGLQVITLLTDGQQPVGRGIGPALEAHDVLSVLRCERNAPADLRQRALHLAGAVLEQGGAARAGQGERMATELLEKGTAYRKLGAICKAQGSFRAPGRAPHRAPVFAQRAGIVRRFDNRRLSQAAKLAGAPADPTAGVELAVQLGTAVVRGQVLFTLHAESRGELAYAQDYVQNHDDIITVARK